MIYEFINAKGERREVVELVDNRPPEWITFNPDGTWSPATANDPLAFNRDFGGSRFNTQQVRGKYPIVSRTLPRGLKGAKTDEYGNSVLTSKQHEREVLAQNEGRFKRQDW